MLRGYNGSDVFMIPPPTEPRTSLCEIYHSNTNIDSQSHLPATWLLRIYYCSIDCYNASMCLYVHEAISCVYMSTSPCHVSLCPRVHVMCLYFYESISYVFMSTSPCHVFLCPWVHYMCLYVHESMLFI